MTPTALYQASKMMRSPQTKLQKLRKPISFSKVSRNKIYPKIMTIKALWKIKWQPSKAAGAVMTSLDPKKNKNLIKMKLKTQRLK